MIAQQLLQFVYAGYGSLEYGQEKKGPRKGLFYISKGLDAVANGIAKIFTVSC